MQISNQLSIKNKNSMVVNCAWSVNGHNLSEGNLSFITILNAPNFWNLCTAREVLFRCLTFAHVLLGKPAMCSPDFLLRPLQGCTCSEQPDRGGRVSLLTACYGRVGSSSSTLLGWNANGVCAWHTSGPFASPLRDSEGCEAHAVCCAKSNKVLSLWPTSLISSAFIHETVLHDMPVNWYPNGVTEE